MKRVEVGITDAEDEELKRVSEGMGLSLSLEEMRRIKQYFVMKNREPTDVELQSIAQAWSEHCCYKSSKNVLEAFIFGIEAPQNILVIKEDAAVLEFDEEHAYVLAFESHNHPSAIEPYGGAATGIGGIIRDVVCMGAQPVALVDPLFFGPLDYPDEKLPEEVKHPRFLFTGVVAGISDYGNRIGIPTCAGMIYFHEGYVGNCVVNVGCVGIMKKADLRRSMAKTGEVLVLVGGKTGRDGIHGVTFASVELTGEEEFRSAVQLGDPITKEPLMHAILEANEKRLISGMKDLGGGGLSCAVSEMCHAGGCGAEIHLERVKLKEEGLSAWEIWVSESQERFLITTEPDKVGALLEIFEKWDVDATVIGQTKPFFIKESFTKEKKYSPVPQITILHNGEQVFELETGFLLSCPMYVRPREVRMKEREGLVEIEEPEGYNEILKLVLASPNIASRDFVIRQYDHEVRASTVLKPMQGRVGKETHGDAAVIKPLEESYKGIAITSDVNPSFCRLNPFWGAASAVDEVCRNLTSVGAVPHSFADCLNFGNPEKPDRMGEFYECCRGLGYMASSLGIPFVSGNVSFYNESAAMRESIPPTPTILGIGLCDDVRECITVDVKDVGNFLYLIGETKEEFGGSEYYKLRRVEGGIVPRTDPEVLRRGMEALREAMGKGLIASCHDISEGGLAVAVCEMVLGGDIGASIDVAGVTPNKPLLSLSGSLERGQSPRLRVSPSGKPFQGFRGRGRSPRCGGTGGARDGAEPHMRSDYTLFSESNTRWVVEVWSGEARRFEELMNTRGICIANIGETIGEKRVLMRDGGKQLVDLSLEEVRKAWTGKIW
ncbi:MAG: phosphoribosylformylglycinamidine synthase subunit PurL [archaeon]|nr:phosphoribosylformylglycinamidine synthase subunit PurL [archaeon]